MEKLEKGAIAPEFEAYDQFNKKHKLSDYKGKKIVLYFYPKDDTPGCTKESCNLRDNYEILISQGYVVLGVSSDTIESHLKFSEKYNLPFPLLADIDKNIINDYEAWGTKNMYGKISEGILRKTYIIDEEGIITNIIKKVKTENHTEQILK